MQLTVPVFCIAKNTEHYQKQFAKLPKESREWLTTALDPFHDYDHGISGMPDQHCESSSVRCFREVLTISRPPNVIEGESWDCFVGTFPFTERVSMTNAKYTVHGVVGTDDDATPSLFGTVTAIRTANGQPIAGNTMDPATYTHNICSRGGETLPPNTPARIIAGGFEVHNVTANLYKGGSVIVYDAGMSHRLVSLPLNRQLSATPYGNGCLTVSKGYPINSAIAANHPDCRSWEAADGCYVPFRLNVNDTDYNVVCNDVLVLAQEFEEKCTSTEFTVSAGGGVKATTFARPAPIGLTGAYFVGLPSETVLKLTVRVYIECAPVTRPDELALISPAAPYDPRALSLYRNTICLLPPGVPVGYNEKGDWWRMILKSMEKAAPMVSAAAAVIPEVGVPLSLLVDQAGKAAGAAYTRSKDKAVAKASMSHKQKK